VALRIEALRVSGLRRHPLLTYFAAVYAVSAGGLAFLGLPRLSPGGMQNPNSLVVFPILILSVAAAGVALTAIADGCHGLLDLWARMHRLQLSNPAYLVPLLPPMAVVIMLSSLSAFVSHDFALGWQLFGLPIGAAAGFFEEIGWTGFAYPRMRSQIGAVAGTAALGIAWGLSHLPVVDSLGAASPHGPAWPAYFVAFVGLVAAVRCLICWAYDKTESVLLAQLIHAGFTGTLILLSAPHVNGWQEAGWYAAYAALLWLGLLTGFVIQRRRGAPRRSSGTDAADAAIQARAGPGLRP
jgi:CAAX protease family protein